MDYGACNVPAGLSNVTSIAAGYLHAMAIISNGSVVAWGSYVSITSSPYAILGSAALALPSFSQRIVALAGGTAHSLALTESGQVIVWGRDNTYHQLDMPPTLGHYMLLTGNFYQTGLGVHLPTSAPAQYSVAKNVIAISSMGMNSIALLANGTIAVWGDNTHGQLYVPTSVSTSKVTMVAAGWHHYVVVLAYNAGVAAWGSTDGEQCDVPAQLAGLTGATSVTAVSAGYRYSVVLLADGTITMWGIGYGYGDSTLPDISVITAIAGGYEQLAVMSDCYAAPPPPSPPSPWPPSPSPIPPSPR